jgi:large subunit ribosomal protein L4
MQVRVYKQGKLTEGQVDQAPFGDKVLYRTLREAVLSYQANQRQGTLSTKGRSDVAGSRKKPWKQKHTGRARAGDRKSPIWRGGGTVFGPKPRDYGYQLPAKEKRVALRSAILGKLEAGELVLADLSGFTAPSAKAARAVLREFDSPRRAIVVTAERNVNVWKSFRNFPGVNVRTALDVCAFDLVAGGLVVFEEAALAAVAERVGKTPLPAAAPSEESEA